MDYLIESLRTIVENGVFGPAEFISTSLEDDADKGDQFGSEVYFVTIKIKRQSIIEQEQVVIKTQTDVQAQRELLRFDDIFKNEVLTYRDLFPIMDTLKINAFPKFYHGVFTEGKDYKKDIIILEDLRKFGFVISKEKLVLDKKHLLLTFKKLGEFHGLSLIAKKETKFRDICARLSLSKFETNPDLQANMMSSMKRGILPLLEKGRSPELLEKLLNELKCVVALAKKLFRPEEPFSVLCHGDFNRNNIFFKYDNNGDPVDLRFFDLQNARYTSPAIDLAFILYMNTTAEDRRENWDEYLKTYWEGLLTTSPNPGFDFDQFYDHFNKRAIFGYIPCSFFIPTMMVDVLPDISEVAAMSKEEQDAHFSSLAGEEGTKAVCDIVEHLLERGSIEKYFEL